jgi:thioredoxin 1
MSEHEAATLNELLNIASQNKAIVVDFYATWCGPCVRIAPFVQAKCQESGVTLVKVNVDVNGDASQRYNIQAMPTFKVLNSQGNEIYSATGGSEDIVKQVVAIAASNK